jgi:5'-nucleotidase
VLEGIFTGVNQDNGEEVTSFVQVSEGIKIEYNPENNNGSKLVSVTIADEPLDREQDYQVVTLDFIAGGGDNFFGDMEFPDAVSLATQDDVLTAYIEQMSPVDIELSGRIAIVDGQANETATGGAGGNSTESEEDTEGGNSTASAGGQQGAAARVGGFGTAAVAAVMGSAFFALL